MKMDPCVLSKRRGTPINSTAALQVDDRRALGTRAFMDSEEKAAIYFKYNPHQLLHSQPTVSNGVPLYRRRSIQDVVMDLSDKIAKLEDSTDGKTFAGIRVMVQYIWIKTCPDVCTSVQLVLLCAEETKHSTRCRRKPSRSSEGRNYRA